MTKTDQAERDESLDNVVSHGPNNSNSGTLSTSFNRPCTSCFPYEQVKRPLTLPHANLLPTLAFVLDHDGPECIRPIH